MPYQLPDPVEVLHLFPALRGALLAMLRGLSDAQWPLPTACAGWSVKDVVQHLLGDDLGLLSRRRDAYRLDAQIDSLDDLIAFVNDLNESWVQATRRLSPRVLCDLLAVTGPPLDAYLASLDLAAMGGGVGWTGHDSDPVWLDVAREYTEYWHHQQHIREAVGQPLLLEPRFLAPLLATLVHGIPHAYRATDAPDGTLVQIVITGEAGGTWHVLREAGRWTLYADTGLTPASVVRLDGNIAWKLFTKGISPDEAARHMTLAGDEALGRVCLGTVSILA